MSKRTTFSGVAVLVLVALLLTSSGGALTPATAAPMAAPTPVSVTRPSSGEAAGYITFTPFASRVITVDTTATCQDIGRYSVLDVLYSIDQTDVNTVTLTTKWSVDGVLKATGINVVASNAADATDMQQVQAFGKYLCLLADVTNTSPVTITVQVLAK